VPGTPTPTLPVAAQRRAGELFGHPTCLFTLFFAELWERFSFYGMKALLILYMVNYLLWNQQEASHVMQWYAGLVYCTPVLGGIIADRWIGARWSVVIGGVLIAIGHFLLAFEPLPFFYSGLGFLIAGVGLLKPNVSTQVGSLYRPDDQRRDSAFSIFYMGINIGAFLGPIICGWLRLTYGYHYGFAAAGVGMVIGLVVYIAGMRSVVRRTEQIATETRSNGGGQQGSSLSAVAAATPDHVYRDRVIALLVIFLIVTLFWMAFEQAANVLNLWADKYTNLHIFQGSAPEAALPGSTNAATPTTGPRSWSDFKLGAEPLQSVNPLFVIIFAGVFGWFWLFLERRRRQPSTPAKLVFGFLFMGLAYAAMMAAAARENQPTSAPLARVPTDMNLADYGATRLRFDEPTRTLRLCGVLTDTDRLRALADSSPLRESVDQLVERFAKANADTRELSVTVPEAPRGLPDEARWDAAARMLTVTRDFTPERVRLPFLAANADPDFQAAIDSLFQQSSVLRVSVLWLVLFYLLATIGELCLSPVGLSLVTKAAPPRFVGLFMGLWFLMTGGVANWTAHLLGGMWGTMTPSAYFTIFAVISLAATVVMLLLLRLLKPLLHGIR
jgi:POT family proton-dependent oligopeptide transporter